MTGDLPPPSCLRLVARLWAISCPDYQDDAVSQPSPRTSVAGGMTAFMGAQVYDDPLLKVIWPTSCLAPPPTFLLGVVHLMYSWLSMCRAWWVAISLLNIYLLPNPDPTSSALADSLRLSLKRHLAPTTEPSPVLQLKAIRTSFIVPEFRLSMSSYRSTTTINALPDDVFVEIFSICRMDEVDNAPGSHLPWGWHRLAHVCRTWRHIMFASSHHLRLELLCTHGTPVKKNIGHLPAFPIVISFPSSSFPRTSGERDDFFAALEHRDRVRVIELNFPYTLSGELATVMQEPFPALTHLLIESDIWGAMPALPDSFLGGSAPRLQTISISGIPFPAAPTLFSSAHDLVKIDLSDIPPAGHIPPEAMVAGLAALPRLKFLTFEFEMRMPFSYPDRMRLLPITRTTLPALTTFYFKGLFEYFEDFVAQIDAPQLISLRIELCQLEDTGFQLPQLFKFFDRSEKFKLSRFIHTDIFMSNAVAIELDRHCWRSSFSITVPEKAMGQVVSQLSAMLSNVTRLFVHFNGAGDDIQWLEIFRPFTSVKALSVIGDLSSSYCILLTLKNVTGERAAEVLPALELLYLENQPAKSVKKFVAARQKVGRPVAFIGEKRKFEERLNTLDVDE
ncbi:hypothetical protein EDB84DRAFT_1559101 [Lactarius hengduanensis]|nr:hypothetical protein EDB84DRAFT_1559101 [Lactarius hengduanensis]